MQNKYTKHILFLSLLLGWFASKAQDPMSLYYLENVPQSNFVNPAMAPRCNGFIGVPGVNSIYINYQSNLPADVLLQSTDSGTVSLLSQFYDYGKLYDAIGDGAKIRSYELISPLIFGFRLDKGYVTFSMSEKVKLNMNIASDLFKMPEIGFSPGTTFDFGGTGLDAQLYSEYALGYSRNITQKLRLGTRVKLLQGLASIKSDISKASLETSNEVWNLDARGDIYSSGPLEVTTDEDGNIDVKIKDEFTDMDVYTIFNDYGTNFSNLGFAIDIGATYELNNAWTFSASLNDLGFISWKNDLNSIHFSGKYNFEGIDTREYGLDIIDNDSLFEEVVSDLMDTIKTVINYSAGTEKFTTGIGTMLHIGAQYNLNHVVSVGILSRSTFDRDYFHQEFNLSVNANLYQSITANLNYNVALTGENYLGLGFAIRGGPLQFYVLFDHIPITYTNYVLENGNKIPAGADMRAFNVMLGINLVFGAHGFKDEPKIDAYSEF